MKIRLHIAGSMLGQKICGHIVSDNSLRYNEQALLKFWQELFDEGRVSVLEMTAPPDHGIGAFMGRFEADWIPQSEQRLCTLVHGKRLEVLRFDGEQWKPTSEVGPYVFGQQELAERERIEEAARRVRNTIGQDWPIVW